MAEQQPQNPTPHDGGMPDEATFLEYASLGLAWLVPGAGHMAIGQTARGIVFAIAIHTLFLLGMLIGGIRVINPISPPLVDNPAGRQVYLWQPDQPIWSYTQFLTGWPMIAANFVQKQQTETPPDYAPRIQDVGAVYCGTAGMLNLLVMLDLAVRITTRGLGITQALQRQQAGAQS